MILSNASCNMLQLQIIYDIIQSYEWLKRKQLRQQKENNKKNTIRFLHSDEINGKKKIATS